MVRITLPDKSIREYEGAVTAEVVALDIGARLAKDAYGARVDGVLSDVMTLIKDDSAISIVTARSDPAGSLELIRHSCAHVMAEAICSLFPATQLVYGPVVENGFYYDIDLERPLSTEDFAAIEARMGEIIKEDRPFVRYEVGKDEALERLAKEGNRLPDPLQTDVSLKRFFRLGLDRLGVRGIILFHLVWFFLDGDLLTDGTHYFA